MSIDEKLIQFLRTRHGLITAELTAMRAIRSSRRGRVVEICGRDAETGLPATVKIGAQEIRDAISRRP